MSMPIGILATILGKVFSFVFRASKETSKDASAELVAAFNAVRRIGTARIKEFILALPIFIEFVRQLLKHRANISAKKQLYIIGAAASLTTLGLLVVVSVLSSLPVQLLLILSYPVIGIPLLVSGGLVISTITIVMAWLIIYFLNLMMADDPIYQMVREQYVPKHTQEVLDAVKVDLEQSGADMQKLRTVMENQLQARGSDADPQKLNAKLEKLESRLQSKAFTRMAGIAEKTQPPTEESKDA